MIQKFVGTAVAAVAVVVVVVVVVVMSSTISMVDGPALAPNRRVVCLSFLPGCGYRLPLQSYMYVYIILIAN